jgi:hypothetical protein
MALYCFCSLANADALIKGPPRELFTRDVEEAKAWCAREDQPGRGVYRGSNILRDGATTRSKDNVAEIVEIVVDIDSKDIADALAVVDQRLAALPCPPTRVNDTGHGRHAIWELREPIDTTDAPAMAAYRDVYRQLIHILCGDPRVSHEAALYRVVGTHNTKFGERHEVCTVQNRAVASCIEELQDWLAEVEHPIFTAKAKTNGAAAPLPSNDPWSQFDGVRAPVDVEARLAAMQFQGPGDNAVHTTELDVMNALLGSGMPLPDAVATVLSAVMKLQPAWDRGWEERKLRKLGLSFLAKHPDVCERHGWDSAGNLKPQPKAARVPIIRPHTFRDPDTLPARPFLLGTSLLRGSVSALAAPGGIGKSAYAMTCAIALASAHDLLGEEPRQRCRVFYWGGEETQDEIDRRIGAICVHHGITADDLAGWVYTSSGHDVEIKLARSARSTGIEFNLHVINQIVEEVDQLDIDVIILDPLVSLHGLSENDNVQMDQLIKKLAWLANHKNCAVLVLHHSRKGQVGQTEHSIDDVRGGSAIVDACRHVTMLSPMTVEEATQAGINFADRDLYVRVYTAKTNYARRGGSRWVHFELRTLACGEQIAIPVPWEFKVEGTTEADDIWVRGLVLQDPLLQPRTNTTNWIGLHVGARLGLNPHDDIDRKRIMLLVNRWLRTGVLGLETRADEKGRRRQYLIPGPNKSSHATSRAP